MKSMGDVNGSVCNCSPWHGCKFSWFEYCHSLWRTIFRNVAGREQSYSTLFWCPPDAPQYKDTSYYRRQEVVLLDYISKMPINTVI